jgi:hypothetical protein
MSCISHPGNSQLQSRQQSIENRLSRREGKGRRWLLKAISMVKEKTANKNQRRDG